MATTLGRRDINRRMLSVDYPRQNEVITSDTYTVRVFAPTGAKSVGISIDQGPWRSCRPAVGYWWYDWSGYADGEYEIVTSMATPDGKRIICEPHEFFVKRQTKPPAE